MCTYRDKISVIIAKMFSLRRSIRLVDQEVLDIYLAGVHREAETLTRAFRPEPVSVPPVLAKLFQERGDNVEGRLRKGLETVRYLIDAPDTLSLIVGPERVEEVSNACYVSVWRKVLRASLTTLPAPCRRSFPPFICYCLETSTSSACVRRSMSALKS